jgi:hypothetical protein
VRILIEQNLVRFKLFEFWGVGSWQHVNVVLEIAFFYATVWELHSTQAVLDSLRPISLSTGAVKPENLAVTVLFIVFLIASISVSTFPDKSSGAILLLSA